MIRDQANWYGSGPYSFLCKSQMKNENEEENTSCALFNIFLWISKSSKKKVIFRLMWFWKLLWWWYCFYNLSGLCKRQVDIQHITFLFKIPGYYRNGICELRGLKLRGDDQPLSQNIFPRSYVGCSSSEFVVVVLLVFVCVFVCVFPCCGHIWNPFLYLYCPHFHFCLVWIFSMAS